MIRADKGASEAKREETKASRKVEVQIEEAPQTTGEKAVNGKNWVC